MNKEVEQRLAESLTADSTDIIPYLPYLLQDFWSLASDPEEMAELVHTYTGFGPHSRLLDLACGKGAVAIHLTKEFGCSAKGIDLIEAFIAEAKEKAAAYSVDTRCTFMTGDVNDAVVTEQDYDLVIWGGAGDLLGGYAKTLERITRTIRPGGYILLDDGFIHDAQQALRFKHQYLTKAEWVQTFQENRLTICACREAAREIDPAAYAEDLDNIRKRAEELTRQHPEKAELFRQYVASQQAEYEDLQDGLVGAVWLLRKGEG